jgi:hypothetical protein
VSLLETFLDEDLVRPLPYDGSSVRRVVFIAIRNDDVIGSGTLENPYNGSNDTRLDGILRDLSKIPENMTIRFGPGTFRTKGNGVNPKEFGFSVRSGQRFIGAGMYQTTIQLVKTAIGTNVGQPYATGEVFTNPGVPVADVEISDLTIDCNGWRQPRTGDINDPKLDPANIKKRGQPRVNP